MSTFDPTDEQKAIVEAAKTQRASLMIRAYAGASKTTTLELLSRAVVLPTLYIVFNVKNKKEAEARFPSHVTVTTVNGLGHKAWGAALRKRLEVDDRKLGKLVTAQCKSAGFSATTEQWGSIRELVSAAMLKGLVPKEFAQTGLLPDTQENWQAIADEKWIVDAEPLIDLARQVLIASIRLSLQGIISFDDQIYMSALFGGSFQQYPLVLVDEAQDQNVLNHIMIRRSASGRLGVVGDEKQSVYAFRGATEGSMEKLRALRDEWIDLPLTTTFRCAKKIVARQQAHAPGFQAWHANAEGEVIQLPIPRNDSAMEHQPTMPAKGWTWHDVPQGQSIAVLCRNNAPLLSMAFKLLRKGTGVVMLGRDIGKGLEALAKKLCPHDDMPIESCIKAISEWQQHEVSLAMANEQEQKAEGIVDRAECLKAVCEADGVRQARDLRTKLQELFARDRGTVTLATGHRAKGLEWHTVLHLDPFRIPSKYARSAREKQQELNIKYVIETRAKHTLIEARMEDFV